MFGGVVDPVLSQYVPEIPTATNTSIEGVTDGGIVLRIGKNHGRNLRNYELNGFSSTGEAVIDGAGKIGDVRDSDRSKYGTGDVKYQFSIAGVLD